MSTDIGVAVHLSGALPLLDVLIGSGSTILVQRSSAHESKLRDEAERRQAQRAEIKSAPTVPVASPRLTTRTRAYGQIFDAAHSQLPSLCGSTTQPVVLPTLKRPLRTGSDGWSDGERTR